MHFSDPCFCGHRDFLLKYPLSEEETWSGNPDFEYSRRCINNGICKYRYNPRAIVHITKSRILNPFPVHEWDKLYRGKSVEEIRVLMQRYEWYIKEDQLDESKVLPPCTHGGVVQACCLGSVHPRVTREQIEDHHKRNDPKIIS